MIPERIATAARRRLEQPSVRTQIDKSLSSLAMGVPLAAEWDSNRLAARLAAKAELSRPESEAIARDVVNTYAAMSQIHTPLAGPEKIWGNTYDFIPIAFLDRGSFAAQAVARVAYLDQRPQGSGFLISHRLFLTNNHVIPTPEACRDFCLEFDFQQDARGRRVASSRFYLDPGAFFLTDEQDDLDYTLVAVGERIDGPRNLDSFGYCALSDAPDKHALGEFVNLIQHPNGRFKELVLRENRLIARESHVLHYVADTEPGSSGSPVLNDQWQVVALHHWGGPWRQKVDASGNPLTTEVNEGIRASAIVNELRDKAAGLSQSQRELLETALALAEGQNIAVTTPSTGPLENVTPGSLSPTLTSDGRVTWCIPLELSIQLPCFPAHPARSAAPSTPSTSAAPLVESKRSTGMDSNYSGRSGYKPKFISGHTVPLPELSDTQKKKAAPNLLAEPGDDDFELRYHHFSVVMNAERRLAFFTACNIDGKNAKKVDRKTGTVKPMTLADIAHESFNSESSEATEKWYVDDRISTDHQTNQALYDAQVVAGYGSRAPGRLGRMLQRGHLVRRMDPAWGSDTQALAADADTFHFSNCVPQFGFFNMGSAKSLQMPRSGNGLLWRALENHVLNNAVAEDLRVSCFTGPIFKPSDWEWRDGIHIPRRFWKIVVWSDKGKLRSLAMMADQGPVFDAIGSLPESATDEEAYEDLEKVEDFLSTIVKVEKACSLNFGDLVRDADIRSGEGDKRVASLEGAELLLPSMKKR